MEDKSKAMEEESRKRGRPPKKPRDPAKRSPGRPPGARNKTVMENTPSKPADDADSLHSPRKRKQTERFSIQEEIGIGKGRGRPSKEAILAKVRYALKQFEQFVIEEGLTSDAANHLITILPLMFPDSDIATKLYEEFDDHQFPTLRDVGPSTSYQIVTEHLSPKKRGRPSKNPQDIAAGDPNGFRIQIENLPSSPKRRGRPPKPLLDDDAELLTSPRKRGRPKKRSSLPDDLSASFSGYRIETELLPVSPKKRGRPPKHASLSATGRPVIHSMQKKKGRPFKSNSTGVINLRIPLGLKKRGRPRKQPISGTDQPMLELTKLHPEQYTGSAADQDNRAAESLSASDESPTDLATSSKVAVELPTVPDAEASSEENIKRDNGVDLLYFTDGSHNAESAVIEESVDC